MRQLQLFRLIFRATRWLRRRLTPAGEVLAALTLFAAAFGLDTEANAAHQLFSMGAALLLLDAVGVAMTVRLASPQLAAQRVLPEFLTAGDAGGYRIEIRNLGMRALPPLTLVEELCQSWPTLPELRRQRGKQRLGYPAFIAVLRRLRAIDIAPIDVPALLPGQTVTLKVDAGTTARGRAGFDRLVVDLSGPLGLIVRQVAVTVVPAFLTVLPARRRVDLPPAGGRRQLQPGGIALAQHVGDSEEFRSLRDYRPGDPLRAIHWRSFARTGKPLVREFQEEFFARHALMLDTAWPEVPAARFEAAVSVAAGLVLGPRETDSLLDLLFVADDVHCLTTGRGLGSAAGLLRVLAGVTPSAGETLTPLVNSVLHHARRTSSLVVILLTWDAAREEAVRRLLATGSRVTVFVLEGDADMTPDAARLWAGTVQSLAVVA
jgi:uncharacterized protein (DUF58 family)